MVAFDQGAARAGFPGSVKAGQDGSVKRGIPHPPPPPLKGGVGGVGKDHSPLPDAERRQWLTENLPTVAGVVAQFAAEFGRENVRVVFASENGHVIGKRSC